VGAGTAGVARNRRPPTTDGKVVRIGDNPGGPVDHSLPVLRVTSGDGDGSVRAIVGQLRLSLHHPRRRLNKFCGDWAGYASEAIEREFPGAIALVTIGCGADANPNPRVTSRTPRTTVTSSQRRRTGSPGVS